MVIWHRLRAALVAGLLVLVFGCSTSSSTHPIISTTVAGSTDSGTADGDLASARFNNPVNVVNDRQGNTYVADFDNGRVRKIDRSGLVSTVINQANFRKPFGLAFTSAGDLYVQTDDDDALNHSGTSGTIWKVALSTSQATVVVRGVGRPRGLLALSDGRLVLADLTHHTISILDPATGVITLLAGKADTTGFVNAKGVNARFNRPYGLSLANNGDIIVADANNHCIRRVTMTGDVTTVAGSSGTSGYQDGQGTAALFNAPQDVATDVRGNIYVADCGNHRFRKIDSLGNVSTIAGDGSAGYKDGAALNMEFFAMEGMDITSDGSALIIADGTGGENVPFHHVRRLTLP